MYYVLGLSDGHEWLVESDSQAATGTMSDVALLRAAIAASGLSVRRYAREVLVRDPRTVWRWLAGETPIPRAVLDRIRQPPRG